MLLRSVQLDKASLSILISAEIDFEQFEAFAEPLALAMDCDIRDRLWGADRHQWQLNFEGSQLWLNYEFYGDICWISTEVEADLEVLEYLITLLQPLITANAVKDTHE
ncbi:MULTISPECIES: DUF3630 family protein [unclassified Shewanella]|uniref:DUF3630 family protein n=1 Tax=unclassified Shewanella TaxID=196818 RepID=UPI000C846DA4|nr:MULTISPECIES: DUF3630 family protein [unclassified Shewanella]MDO6620821.1 DUF3630 family protein [Shewanella sp. 6_MG-2023]MDO6680373.1 DUF3630 family protein [Shewanella sp. 4_MG-2023]MDO6776943.1 DUF3630 family protein [Shewanella sp. 3_MG-2023]PMG30975.1 hypothetical protein BCU94_09760 [Shewanella sp. 10N.286.52.C2]PMG50827.1 hypothetical protein BCU91_01790 [Shewanella sp. 10N.286.52.B9]